VKYSVRDLSMLTAYSALMLAKNQAITIAVIVASVAAMILLVFVFGVSSLRLLFARRQESGSLRSFLPLAAIFASWTLLIAGAQELSKHSPCEPSTVALAMLSGLSSAAIPLMFSLSSRNCELNDETLWAGYWMMCVGMSTAGLVAMLMMQWNEGAVERSQFDSVRLPAIVGVSASVIAGWYLIAKMQVYGEADGEFKSQE
jgi:hypothetical protein